jgi:hypothetical protein
MSCKLKIHLQKIDCNCAWLVHKQREFLSGWKWQFNLSFCGLSSWNFLVIVGWQVAIFREATGLERGVKKGGLMLEGCALLSQE